MMDRRRRNLRWIGIVLTGTLALVALTVGVDRVADAGSRWAASRYLLPILSIALVVLVLGVAGLLIRNLVRLVLDRKRGILGARLRTKLVVFLLGFTLIPALMMVYGSGAVIKRAVEALVRTPVEEITRYARDVVDEWNDFLLVRAEGAAENLGEQIVDRGLADDGSGALSAFVEDWREQRAVDYVHVRMPDGKSVLSLDPGAPVDDRWRVQLVAMADGIADDAGERAGAATRIDPLGAGLLVHAAVPFRVPGGAGVGVASVGLIHGQTVTTKMRTLSTQADSYRRFRVESRELLRLYLTLIVLVLLATLFAATWIGFYMGRRITEPIQEVAHAAREISAGNLGVRVRSSTGDEVGVLVDSFNDMAAQLEESREVISRSNADLRRSNRELDERRRYIETLVENLSTAVVSADTEGRVTTSNPAVERVLGRSLAIGSNVRDALAREEMAPLAEAIREAVNQGIEVRRDMALPLERGTAMLTVQVSPLIGARDERLGTLVMIEDLTDLVRAQRSAAWQEVARRIAHEIKNPLTPIQLSAQRLRKKAMEGSTDLESVIPEATDSIEREVAGLKNLVDEFSRYARMPEVEPRSTDVREIIDSVQALYAGVPQVRWTVEIEPGVERIKVDPNQMRRAIINLVDNSIAAMHGNGEVGIAVRREPRRGVIRIEVSDSGPGIAPADRDRLFVPYFSTKRSGTGLGLAIVHRVVTEHRGSIRVEDNDPHGAKFVMEIPA